MAEKVTLTPMVTQSEPVAHFPAHNKGRRGSQPSGGSILIFSSAVAVVNFEIEFLRQRGCNVVHCSDLRLMGQLLVETGQRWSFILFEIEGFGGPGKVLDRLMHLREEMPSMPVILKSTRSKSHDFSAERLPICDVSLGPLVSESDLDLAVSLAFSHNLMWQLRKVAENPFAANATVLDGRFGGAVGAAG